MILCSEAVLDTSMLESSLMVRNASWGIAVKLKNSCGFQVLAVYINRLCFSFCQPANVHNFAPSDFM